VQFLRKFLNIKCDILYNFYVKNVVILRRVEQDMMRNVYWCFI